MHALIISSNIFNNILMNKKKITKILISTIISSHSKRNLKTKNQSKIVRIPPVMQLKANI